VLARAGFRVHAASPGRDRLAAGSPAIAEPKDTRREQRLRREREREAAERRRARNGKLIAAGLVAATVAVVAFVLLSGGNSGVSPAKVKTLRQLAAAAGCQVRTYPSEGRNHVERPVTYRTNPPTSGPHNPLPAEDGEYVNGPPPKERYVHTLEHGRIELQYAPRASAAARAGLKGVFDEDHDRMLLFENNTRMPYEVAATAWTRLLGCPHYDARVPAAMRAFRDAYRGKAPEQVP
jgi:hypothetical protein